MKEEAIGDNSVIKMQKAGEEVEIVKAYVTHWEEFEQDRIQPRQALELEVKDYNASLHCVQLLLDC
jgi:hypothetical protein